MLHDKVVSNIRGFGNLTCSPDTAYLEHAAVDQSKSRCMAILDADRALWRIHAHSEKDTSQKI